MSGVSKKSGIHNDQKIATLTFALPYVENVSLLSSSASTRNNLSFI